METQNLIRDFVADDTLQIGFTVKFIPVFCLYTLEEKHFRTYNSMKQERVQSIATEPTLLHMFIYFAQTSVGEITSKLFFASSYISFPKIPPANL